MDEEKALRPIEEMLERLTVAATIGEPLKEGAVTLIPVANVAYGFGYGYGSGTNREAAEENAAAERSEGSGAGGGGGGMARPLGFIRVDAEGVRYEPMMDLTRISLAGIFLSAWFVFWIAKTIRAFAGK